eukprot:scaffold119410_cov18-Prasinocladus_malaysianus.AAC.1
MGIDQISEKCKAIEALRNDNDEMLRGTDWEAVIEYVLGAEAGDDHSNSSETINASSSLNPASGLPRTAKTYIMPPSEGHSVSNN